VNKTAASAAQFPNGILLHTYSCTAAARSCASTNKTSLAYLTSWHNSVFGFKLRTD